MYCITKTYTDYDGNERTEDFYFNLTKAELLEMELTADGGLERMLKKIISEQNSGKLINIFKELIFKAYGEKSADGRRFIKSKELSEAFAQTQAYSDLFMELAFDADKAAEFVNKTIPADISQEVQKQTLTVVET